MHADTSKPTSLPASPSGLSSSERREVLRHPFIDSAQEIDLTSGARLSAPVSEPSLKGCYLDTLNADQVVNFSRWCYFHRARKGDLPASKHGNRGWVLSCGTGTARSLAQVARGVER